MDTEKRVQVRGCVISGLAVADLPHEMFERPVLELSERDQAVPALGGWMTDSYSWSWIFYINIPVGLFAAAVTWAIYRDRETSPRKLPIDVVGLGALVLWVAALQIMLDKGKDLDWFSSPVIVTLAVVALLGFAFFVIWELTEKNPVIDLRLFKRRNFLGGTVAISVAYAVPDQPDASLPATLKVLTFTSCNPRYSAAQRIVIHALLTGSQPKSAGLPPALSKYRLASSAWAPVVS